MLPSTSGLFAGCSAHGRSLRGWFCAPCKMRKTMRCCPSMRKKIFARKPVREDAPETPVINGVALGVGFQAQQCLCEVGFCPGPDGGAPHHWRDSRICWKTSRHDSPGLRSRSNSVSASSSACRSAGEAAPPSSKSVSWISARRAKSWERSLAVSFGSSSRICALLTV
jgi:hypothetical protein